MKSKDLQSPWISKGIRRSPKQYEKNMGSDQRMHSEEKIQL